jgi:hypothetical protein
MTVYRSGHDLEGTPAAAGCSRHMLRPTRTPISATSTSIDPVQVSKLP